MICEGRHPCLVSAAADIYVAVIVSPRQEGHSAHIEPAVLSQRLSELENDLLTRARVLYVNPAETGGVHAEIVDKTVFRLLVLRIFKHNLVGERSEQRLLPFEVLRDSAGLYRDRLNLTRREDRVAVADTALSARGFGGDRLSPRGRVEARPVPARNFTPCVIELADTKIVEVNGRLSADETVSRVELSLRAVLRGSLKGQREFRRASESRLLELPDLTAEAVDHAVSELYADDVLALGEVRRQVVIVIVEDIVRVRDVGREQPAGDPLSVYEELIEPEPADRHLGGRDLSGCERLSEIRRGNLLLESRVLAGRRDESG